MPRFVAPLVRFNIRRLPVEQSFHAALNRMLAGGSECEMYAAVTDNVVDHASGTKREKAADELIEQLTVRTVDATTVTTRTDQTSS